MHPGHAFASPTRWSTYMIGSLAWRKQDSVSGCEKFVCWQTFISLKPYPCTMEKPASVRLAEYIYQNGFQVQEGFECHDCSVKLGPFPTCRFIVFAIDEDSGRDVYPLSCANAIAVECYEGAMWPKGEPDPNKYYESNLQRVLSILGLEVTVCSNESREMQRATVKKRPLNEIVQREHRIQGKVRREEEE
ncbi:hypothetical protein BJ508DRAFT_314237 [Ascobolus immersus RN42]|uniref:Uncharacterized protein n=1 Tax=Ascobolus immersus RN42 TaxID=1160509 RepID=A0A3N4HMA0_ASCIM|nr:hypothetical protein BJ508DRAFT_314237 [Ascobolus immersus RN42]